MVEAQQLSELDEIRQTVLLPGNGIKFISLIHPLTVCGNVHQQMWDWWDREDAKNYQLVLLPRDHGKSRHIAYRVVREILRNPAIRILYLSSTANLATKQLKFIKDILTSSQVRKYWPELVNEDEAKREKWTESEISVDHPLRKLEAVRDPTVFCAGLTTNIAGLHCDIAVFDDVVVKENAYTEEGRQKVREQFSLLASIEGANAREWIAGTRYDPNDLYNDLVEMEINQYDTKGNVTGSPKLYEVFQRQVEDVGDGSGEFVWPRQRRFDGQWFGFNRDILEQKRTKYIDKLQFRAQYYNDPNDRTNAAIGRECFQYYDKDHLSRIDGRWFFKSKRLNVYAAIDFAYSLSKKADYTTIVVVGIDAYRNYYVLDIDRFKVDRMSEYYDHILKMHQKWDFRKIRAEVTAAQDVIVKDLKFNYILRDGLNLAVEDYRPSQKQGSKEERINIILQPRYQERMMWHYQGGMCSTLEEELILVRPPHDDIKDALATCVDMCQAPATQNHSRMQASEFTRFGGIA
jgi:hypothetical protein